MTARISQAEAASRPKPFRERLIAQLEAVSPQIIPALRRGQTNFAGDFKTHHFTDLQRLASEPEARQFITFRETGRQIISNLGITNSAEFTLNPSLLNP